MKLIKILFISVGMYFILSIIFYLNLLIPTIILLILTSPFLYKLIKKRKISIVEKLTKKMDSMNGYEFEDYLKKLFISKDYKVKATPLSNDQGADLLLNKNNEKIVIQAKRYSKPVGNKAVQEVLSAKHYYDCQKAIVITNNSFTKSAKELAKKIDVDLWDRKKLMKFIHSNQF